MFKLCRYVPFSITTLSSFKDTMDWKFISSSYLYEKNYDFIKTFHDVLSWDILHNTCMNPNEIAHLIFNKYMPIKFALKNKWLSLNEISQLNDLPHEVLQVYGIKNTDSLNNLSELFYDSVCPEMLKQLCLSEKYIPNKKGFRDILYKNGCMIELFKHCKPDVDFIEEYVKHAQHTSSELWRVISALNLSKDFIIKYKTNLHWDTLVLCNKIDIDSELAPFLINISPSILSKHAKLTPEYMDKHADKLDWYYLCEFQELPEWLLFKHLDKLNWGQISLYQDLSNRFMDEFISKLNEIKMKSNKYLNAYCEHNKI